MKDILDFTGIQAWQQKTSFGHDILGFNRYVAQPKERVHLIHGNGFSAGSLIPLLHLLPKDWDCCISNLPGQGGSTWPQDRMPDWAKMADAIAESLRKEMDIDNKGPVVGIGHSFGGVLTLIAASRNPDLFSRIILLDPILIPPALSVIQYFMRVTGLWKKTASYKSVNQRKHIWPSAIELKNELYKKRLYRNFDPQVMAHFVDSASHTNKQGHRQLSCPPRYEASIFASFPKSLWKSVKKLSTPTDIVVAKDTYFFVHQGSAKASKLSQWVSVHEFGEKHCFPLEEPNATIEFIMQLLANNNAPHIGS